MSGPAGDDGRQAARDGPQPIPAIEWVVAALGLLLVVGAVAFLVVDAVRGDDRPPDVAVRADTIVAVGGGWLVRFTARNGGTEPVAEVGVAGELRDAAGAETSRATLDHLPGRSTREGGLVFQRDPRHGRLVLRVEGWRAP